MKKAKAKIVSYKDDYKQELYGLLCKFSKDVYDSDVEPNVQEFVKSHFAIYLLLVDNKVEGFTSFCYNSFYGLRKPVVFNSCVYISDKYRNSRLASLLFLQSGKMCKDLSVGLQAVVTEGSSSSKLLGRFDKANKVCDVYEVSYEDMVTEYNRLKNKFKVEE